MNVFITFCLFERCLVVPCYPRFLTGYFLKTTDYLLFVSTGKSTFNLWDLICVSIQTHWYLWSILHWLLVWIQFTPVVFALYNSDSFKSWKSKLLLKLGQINMWFSALSVLTDTNNFMALIWFVFQYRKQPTLCHHWPKVLAILIKILTCYFSQTTCCFSFSLL